MERHNPQLSPKTPELLTQVESLAPLAAEKLPWLDNTERASVALTKLTFQGGAVVIIGSAGTPQMNRISVLTCEKSTNQTNDTYTQSDRLFLRAAEIRAQPELDRSPLITRVRDSKRVGDFADFTLEGMHQSPQPNSMRVYFARTMAGQLLSPQELSNGNVEPTTSVLIRLCVADKKTQVPAMMLFTNRTRRQNRVYGAGR